MKYIIKETQNTQSDREGQMIEVSTLSLAKRAATLRQCFQGTVLKVESEGGNLLAVKENGKWRDIND